MIILLIAIFFARGGQHNPQMVKTFGIALVLVLVMFGVRFAFEASKRKKVEQDKQLAADNKKPELFTKPRDF
jgi:hypothetical protein